MLWDFEWSNRQMMRNLYIRQQSLFSTPLAARKLPDAGELKLLEPLRGQVPTKCSPGVHGPGHRWLGHHPRPAVASPGPARTSRLAPEGDRLVNARASRWRSPSSTASRAWSACCCRGSATWRRSASP
jgi:microcin C transport system substrate-binding protein